MQNDETEKNIKVVDNPLASIHSLQFSPFILEFI